MDAAGIVHSYDSRAAVSSAALTRAIMAPHYVQQHHAYSQAPTHTLAAPQQPQAQIQQHNHFTYGPFPAVNTGNLVPPFASNYIQPRPLPRMMQLENNVGRIPFVQPTRQSFGEEHQRQSPPVKAEPLWNSPAHSAAFVPVSADVKPVVNTASVTTTGEVNFGTEVDTLMKAIQAKAQPTQSQTTSPVVESRALVGVSHFTHGQPSPLNGAYTSGGASNLKLTQNELQEEPSSPKGGKKRYQCTIENCTKSFYQKTHLDIHERAHTGVKPYPCKEPGCGRSFSQLGNLKTHERRHTGERPYQCEICGKRFAQRGNVRAHKIVHDQSKPYLCRLDDCGKQFTQLGNLKSHQNKFHIATIRTLTTKFASIKDGDVVNAADKELWEYFANLYKNSNKGIKGRGKDRKVGGSSTSMGMSSSMRGLGSISARGGYGMSGAGRGNMIVSMSHGANRGDGSQYEMFDVDEGSQHSGVASSVSTCYDDAPSDGFEDASRSADLAFGDRIY